MTVHPDAPSALKMGQSVFTDMVLAGQDWTTGLERCGIIFGAKDAEGVGWVAGCAELQNAAADPAHAYAFDAHVQVKSWSRVENWGYEVLGIWHTHPTGPEGPSSTDLAYAQPWYTYPVLWPGSEEGAATLGVFVLDTDAPEGYVGILCEVVEDAGEQAQAVAANNAMRAAEAAHE